MLYTVLLWASSFFGDAHSSLLEAILPFLVLYTLPLWKLYTVPFSVLYTPPFWKLHTVPFSVLYTVPFLVALHIRCTHIRFRRCTHSPFTVVFARMPFLVRCANQNLLLELQHGRPI